jgi:hypothetical protein
MLRTLIATMLLWCTTFCSAQGVITTFRQVTAASAPSGGPPTFVQACDATTWSDQSTGASCVLPSVGAGDVLLIGSQGSNLTVTVNGVPLSTPLDSINTDTIRTWIYPNTSSGDNPIVVQQTSSGTTRLFVGEFSNVGPNPLDAHATGECHGSCPYLGSVRATDFTVSPNDLVWTWCGTDYGGNTSAISSTPEPSTTISQSQGMGYDEGYRVHAAAGSTYSQCDDLSAGFMVARNQR